MNFVFVNNGSNCNKGCQALNYTIIENLEKRYPGSSYILYEGGGHDGRFPMPSPNVTYKRGLYDWGRKARLGMLFKNYLNITIKPLLKQELEDFVNADIIISAGGDVLCGGYWMHWFKQELRAVETAIALKKKCYILGATLGPYTGKKLERKMAKIFNKIDAVSVRDQRSYDYLLSINVDKSKLYLTADPAFLLNPIEYELPPEARGKKIIGVGLSAALVVLGDFTFESLIEFYVDLLKRLLANQDYYVVLVAHASYEQIYQDDHTLGLKVMYELNDKDLLNRIYLHEKHISTSKIKGLIAKCDYFMGPRMHSTIASLSAGVPTISMAFSPKAIDMNNVIFGHTDYACDIFSTKIDNFMKIWEHLVKDSEQIRSHLKKVLPDLRKKAELNFDIVDKLLAN